MESRARPWNAPVSSGWYTVDWASGPGLCHQVRNARRQIERPSSCWSARGRAWCISCAACAPAGPVAPPRRNPQRAARRAASGPAPRRRPLPLASGCLVCRDKSRAFDTCGRGKRRPRSVSTVAGFWPKRCAQRPGAWKIHFSGLLVTGRSSSESGRTQGNLACLLQSKRLIINATQSRNPNRGFQPASPP